MTSFLTWLKQKLSGDDSPADAYGNRPAARISPVPRRRKPPTPPERVKKQEIPDSLDYSPDGQGRIVDGGPGKNVLVRSRYVREDTGTHETLKILDDSVLESEETEEFDPYNTGRFDRSKSWDAPARKK
jgi:hypothetical protein